MQSLGIRLIGHNPPGRSYRDFSLIYVALHCAAHPVDAIRGDVAPAVFDLSVDLLPDRQGDIDYLSNYVFGRRGRRFLTLAWGGVTPGETPADSRFEVFREAAIHLPRPDDPEVAAAVRTGGTMQAEFSLTDERGEPISQSLKPPRLRWHRVPGRRRTTEARPGTSPN